MTWDIDYYERDDGSQPAEIFEDALDRSQPKLAGKLARIAVQLQMYGYQLGGGLIKPCHGFTGLWEMRAIHNQWLGRELFGFDATRVILLHGYVKRSGQAASQPDLCAAHGYWLDYLATHKISPVREDEHEPI